jgi:6-pyruvoyltetrahydropterin/6-carboxytetrahydropterin synthase
MIFLTRRYRFSASHRLHNAALSEEANIRIYGKCNNPFGHGHNYALEVTVAGAVDQATGMVMDLETLDRAVSEEVVTPFDEANLNLDVADFRTVIPTTENLCREIFRRLDRRLGEGAGSRAWLNRVRLEETSSNFFEVIREPGSVPASKKSESESAR